MQLHRPTGAGKLFDKSLDLALQARASPEDARGRNVLPHTLGPNVAVGAAGLVGLGRFKELVKILRTGKQVPAAEFNE